MSGGAVKIDDPDSSRPVLNLFAIRYPDVQVRFTRVLDASDRVYEEESGQGSNHK